MLGPSIAQRAQIENARVSLNEFFLESLERTGPDPVEQFAMQIDSDTAIEEYDWVGDIPGLTEWVNDRAMATLMAGSFSIRNKDWASGIRVHKNEVLDHKLSMVKKRIEGLAAAAQAHYGELLAKFLINGFAGTVYPELGDGLAYDGALFFSDSHSSEEGPNQSNKASAALSEASLEAALKKAAALNNHDGTRPLNINPTHLLCGPNLRFTAERILNSMIVGNTAGTATVTNIHQNRLDMVVSPWLSGAYHNYWFLIDASKPLKPLIMQVREAISSTAMTEWSSEAMFARGEQKFGAQSRDNAGYGAWQTCIGSVVAP